MTTLLMVLAYLLFGLGVSVGVWMGDEDARDETLLAQVALVLGGMLVWPMLIRLRAARGEYAREFDE